MPVNPTNKDAKDRLATEKKITQEQAKQNKFAEGFRDIQKEIKDSIHNMTLSQQKSFSSCHFLNPDFMFSIPLSVPFICMALISEFVASMP